MSKFWRFWKSCFGQRNWKNYLHATDYWQWFHRGYFEQGLSRPPGSILEGAAFVLLGANPPTPSFSAYFVLKTLFLWRFVYYQTISKTATIFVWSNDVFVHLETLKCCWCPWQPDWYKINNWNAKKKESHYFCVHGGWKVLILFCTWKKYPEKENPLWKTTDGKRKRKKKKKFSQEKRKPSTTRIRMARRQSVGWSMAVDIWMIWYLHLIDNDD